jgi:small subunit ribosomal protein S8
MTTATVTEKRKTNKVSNDPISDLLTRIRNAILVRKEQVPIPFSTLKFELANLLQQEGYINHVQIINEDDAPRKSIIIDLKYVEGVPAITGLRKVSKPGLRKYTRAQYAPRVYSGLGISVISTSQGLKTDRRARADKVGGEILCQVW